MFTAFFKLPLYCFFISRHIARTTHTLLRRRRHWTVPAGRCPGWLVSWIDQAQGLAPETSAKYRNLPASWK